MQKKLNLFHAIVGLQAKVNIVMEQKYTAKEYAEMSGGHLVENTKPSLNLSLVKDLNESKMFRSRQQVQTTDARDMMDFAFINMLTLQLLYSDYDTASIAKDYAAKTIQYQGFGNYQQAGSDLYIALNSILTKNLSGGQNAAIQFNKVNIPVSKIKDYLIKLSTGQSVQNTSAFLFNLEKGLDIQDSNYKDLRRLISGWNNLDSMQKKLVVTRLLQFYRTNAIRSELYTILSAYAKAKDLELKNVKNAEKPSKLAKLAAVSAVAVGGFAAGRAIGKRLVG
jgi:hypothetical protein